MMHIRRMNEAHRAFIAHLESHDTVLLEHVRAHGPIPLVTPRPPFEALCRAIVGQQLSTKAATTIGGRLMDWALAKGGLTPSLLLNSSTEDLRALGLSGQKTSYVCALANAWIADTHAFDSLSDMSDTEVVNNLTAIKGIGAWTAQMFLLFTLERPDVFAPRDLGIKKAMERLYGLSMASSDGELVAFSERWSPYRSLACRHLWQVLDSAD